MREYIQEDIENIKQLILSFHSKDCWSVFSDFMAIASYDFSYGIRKFSGKKEKYDCEYYKAYTDEEKKRFSEIFAYFMSAVDKCIERRDFFDVAGYLFHQLDAGNKHTGQFFTPQHLADLAGGMMTKEKVDELIKVQGFVTMLEPSCGGGSMALAAANCLIKYGYNPQQHLCITAVDKDKRCYDMSYMQLTLYGLPAVVIHGDSITNQYIRRAETLMYVMGNWRYKVGKLNEQ